MFCWKTADLCRVVCYMLLLFIVNCVILHFRIDHGPLSSIPGLSGLMDNINNRSCNSRPFCRWSGRWSTSAFWWRVGQGCSGEARELVFVNERTASWMFMSWAAQPSRLSAIFDCHGFVSCISFVSCIGQSQKFPERLPFKLRNNSSYFLLQIKIHRTCPGELDDVVNQLEALTGSVVVGQIGRTVIVYRPSLTKLKAEEKKKQAQRVFMKRRSTPRTAPVVKWKKKRGIFYFQLLWLNAYGGSLSFD